MALSILSSTANAHQTLNKEKIHIYVTSADEIKVEILQCDTKILYERMKNVTEQE